MTMTFLRGAALGALAVLGACGTTGSGTDGQRMSGTNVTRFHLGGEIARGEVAIEPRFQTQAAGGVYQPSFATVVARELKTLGFMPASSPTASEYIATVDVATGTMVALAARSPGSPAVADPTAVATQLAVQMKRRSDGSIVWEGRAQAAARAGAVASASTVQKLARAMFRDFPGETGRTINVR